MAVGWRVFICVLMLRVAVVSDGRVRESASVVAGN